jgi:hypothetical protein
MDLPHRLPQAGIFDPDDLTAMRDVIACMKKHADRDLEAVAITVIRLFQEGPGDAERLWKRCQPLLG